MTITYLGISENNYNLESKQRFAQITANNNQCYKICEMLETKNWEFDVFGEGYNENTIYIYVNDKADFDCVKEWYKTNKTNFGR